MTRLVSGRTKIIAHLGVPTESFKAPMVYNPYFADRDLDVMVVPMGCEAEDYAAHLPLLMRLRNCIGALVTMPHKVPTVALLDEASATVKICGACNAVRPGPDGRLIGDMFDGEGFVRAARARGRRIEGASALVVGAGGVGSAIAASLAAAGIARLALFDARPAAAADLAARIRAEHPGIVLETGSNDPAGFDIAVNGTPLGMKDGDALPFAPERLSPGAFVGEVVMSREITPLLAAARARGHDFSVGTDMLFAQIPAYLEFFGLPSTDAEELRRLSQIRY